MILLGANITKHADGYTAVVTSGSGEVEWTSPEPMDRHRLTEILHVLGCHLIDVWEAFAAADPEIAKKYEEAAERVWTQELSPETAAWLRKLAEENHLRVQEFYRRHEQDEQTYWEETERLLREQFGPEEAIRILNFATKSKHYMKRKDSGGA
jgi:hypothetical protein